MNLSFAELQKEAWSMAESKGFHVGRNGSRDDTLLRLCLVHTEVSEAAQIVKRYGTIDIPPLQIQHLEEFGEELADTVIRIMDLATTMGIDLESAIECKMGKNRNRPYMYGTPQEEK